MDSQLAALRADFDAHSGRSMALPIAGALVWAAVGLKIVSERLGQHVLPGMQAEAAATFASLVDEAEE